MKGRRILEKWMQNIAGLRINTAVWGMLALIWCGLYFPELYFTKETYQPVMIVDGEEVLLQEDEFDGLMQEDALCGLLRADKDQILVRSKLAEWWKIFRERINVWHE